MLDRTNLGSSASAHSAPSGANRQPWHFVVITDPDVKHRIRDAAEREEHEFYTRRASARWLADLEAIPEQLRAVSERTGGKVFLGVSDVPPLAELASTTRRAAGLVSKQPLSNPWFVFLTIAILGTTWVLRRRWRAWAVAVAGSMSTTYRGASAATPRPLRWPIV